MFWYPISIKELQGGAVRQGGKPKGDHGKGAGNKGSGYWMRNGILEEARG